MFRPPIEGSREGAPHALVDRFRRFGAAARGGTGRLGLGAAGQRRGRAANDHHRGGDRAAGAESRDAAESRAAAARRQAAQFAGESCRGAGSGYDGAEPEPSSTVAPAAPLPVPPPAAPPAAMPEPVAPAPPTTALAGRGQVRYAITRGEGGFVVGQAIHTWEHDGFRYRLRSVTETTGLAALFKPARVVQSSEGELAGEGLQPREFRHERVGGVDTASFDWPGRAVAFAGRREAIVGGTQDMLSMYYQLVLLAPTQGALDMPIATGRKLENYRFEVLGEETLALPAGQRRALRVRTRSGGDTIELWLHAGEGAASRGLPLKIRFIDRKGEIFDQIADEAGETQ
jgi:hypothetical protein